jgi:hypothetical protein
MTPCTSGAQLDSRDCTLADDDGPTNSRIENHEIATREEPLVVLFLPTPSLVHDLAFYYIPPLRMPSHPVLFVSLAPETGRSASFFFFYSRRGVVGKSRRASGRKGVTDTRSRSGEFLSRPKTCRILPFPVGTTARLILPARGIMHAELNPRDTGVVASGMN